ncbi:adenylate kinase [Candidatus Peregrinibacteria bacterium]|jgi:adenylate kinase|nr:adenylate kinase [Candidatus Peregrinibacteria bacterium]MBT3599090.1 adenylate kinase [Candidatus Peregrinibacteria bacterium]MBT4367675.1 adenylate kinase [Candidatus Peregrinibacteria bacterium]MBT4585453.1 adenylate kinase [Candidatus Peregrinibacteria bacterium]MBT6730396.1 adenylate kinase [Candidatus Peregrinibacteria bacterium]
MKNDIVLFGVQGSGKGTQAKRLAEEFGYEIFEAGGELRKIVSSGSELGQTVKSYIEAGNLVPHEIIMQVVREAIEGRDSDTSILFDGIPRDADQQIEFEKIMKDVGRSVICIQIKLEDDEAVRRILGRAEKEGRADDADEEVIKKRIDTFHGKTVPAIAKYADKGLLRVVDGDGTVDEVYERLKTAIIQTS